VAGDGDLPINARLAIPAAELSATFARSGGPGGQNVNKVESKVVLRWSPARSGVLSDAQRARLLERLASRLTGDGELVLHASSHRTRARNVEDARERLAELVRDALRERVRADDLHARVRALVRSQPGRLPS